MNGNDIRFLRFLKFLYENPKEIPFVALAAIISLISILLFFALGGFSDSMMNFVAAMCVFAVVYSVTSLGYRTYKEFRNGYSDRSSSTIHKNYNSKGNLQGTNHSKKAPNKQKYEIPLDIKTQTAYKGHLNLSQRIGYITGSFVAKNIISSENMEQTDLSEWKTLGVNVSPAEDSKIKLLKLKELIIQSKGLLRLNNRILGILQVVINSPEEANVLIKNYQLTNKSDLIDDLKNISNSYDHIKSYLSPFIRFGITEKSFPHKMINPSHIL